MIKTQIEIEIPDGYEITSVTPGEPLWQYKDKSEAILYTVKVRPAKPFLINGVLSDWPEWLTCDWVARDPCGEVWGYNCEPEKRTSIWYAVHSCYLLSGVINIDIPGPWKESLRENPRRKKLK